ncbi:HAMP domain-containing histidine kinase [Bacteroides acidifaciens]|uniref:sensor histidine kinase n=1 Tax=Bacteroides acidifaciens TaxID=85831 RepID=UPI002149F469|nr:HAMP domain-containing sensor histidine kinase [Bacteroides acidifaciens]MCR2006024.1 HAMP domain-containing histidine kinase [Bacteroides acidifaciens]
MKLPLKHIVILVICSLAGIFVYQAYWLTGLYRTMKQDMENTIRDAMRTSDFNEIVLRVNELQKDNVEHGAVTVSAGYGADGNSLVTSQTISYTDSTYKDTLHSRTETIADTVRTDTGSDEARAVASSESGLDVLLKKQDSLKELLLSIQQGIHAGVDTYIDINLQRYDSLLNNVLKEHELEIPHHTLLIHTGRNADSTVMYIDTVGMAGDSSYIPTPRAVRYDYDFNMSRSQRYQLVFEPVDSLVWKHMTGILTTSFIILLILGFSFWFLIRTLLRQKTLEEIKSDFTNNITHELKTPIAVAYAANDALLNFNQAEEKTKRDQYLRICQEQLQRLSSLVEQILSMSMERRKTFRLHPEEVNLKELIVSLVEQHQLKADKPAQITLEIEPETLTIVVDRTHFSNIISNLIDNAVKYSKERADITIRCRQTEQTVTISIADRGIGIPLDKQKHIFDKFYRVPTGNLHNVKGYGLGLFYVKSMVEKHGGTITVKSEPGKGSIFTITL